MESIPIGELSKFGLPGLIIGLLAWFAWQRDLALNRVWDARVADTKALTEVIQLNSKTMEAHANASEARNRAAEAQAKSLELAALAQTNLTTEVQRLREVQIQLQNELRELKGNLFRRGSSA